jgi:cysteine desulfurase / selenocysteine lyase
MAATDPTGTPTDLPDLNPTKLIYLDNGATSFPKPEVVYRTMDQFYRTYGVNPGRSGFDLCLEAGSMVDKTRKLLNGLFGGTDPNRVVFGYNSTDALNLAIFGLINPGDHVITTHLEHNSTLRPVWTLEHEHGVQVDWVDYGADGYVDAKTIVGLMKPETKAVVMNHASNVIGTIQDVATIGKACRERGVHLILDVSQSAGVVPVTLDGLGADVICFTGHKSLMGPMGIGGMCVREGVDIRQTRAGGTGVKSAQRHHLYEYPYRMEYGTPNLPGIAGLYAGVTWVLEQGIEQIHAHEMRLWRKLRDGLREIPGMILYCADDVPGRERVAVLSFNLTGFEAADVGTMLDVDYNIACRTGLHCAPMVHEHLGTDKIHGAVRFGIGPFNTDAHIDAAIAAVKDIAAVRAQ